MLAEEANNPKKRLLLLFLCLPLGFAGLAQNLWLESEVSGEVVNNLELSLAPQFRFEEDLKTDEYFFDTGIEYKLCKFFSAGASYRLGNNVNKKRETEPFGRFSLEGKTSYEWNDLQAQLRLRFTNASDYSDDSNEKEYYFRSRLKVEYSVKKLDLIPYGAYELYRNLQDKEFDKSRYEAGLEYKLTKRHRIGAFYRMNDSLTGDETTHIAGLSYKLKL